MGLETNSTSPPPPRTFGSSPRWFRQPRRYRLEGDTPHQLRSQFPAPTTSDNSKTYFFNSIAPQSTFDRHLGKVGGGWKSAVPAGALARCRITGFWRHILRTEQGVAEPNSGPSRFSTGTSKTAGTASRWDAGR